MYSNYFGVLSGGGGFFSKSRKKSKRIDSGFAIGDYPIFFESEIMAGKIFKVDAFLPPDYPYTLLKQKFEGKVAQVILSIQGFGSDRITVSHLRVYSSTRILNDESSDIEEIRATKGLGKAILCYALQQALLYFGNDFDPFSEIIVDLETGATDFYTESEFNKLVQENRLLSKEMLISGIIDWFPMLDAIELYKYLNEETEDELRKMYTTLEEHRKLATYYRNTYGFEPVYNVHDVFSIIEGKFRLMVTVVMEAPISVILQHCD
jgi:hypothetical protein